MALGFYCKLKTIASGNIHLGPMPSSAIYGLRMMNAQIHTAPTGTMYPIDMEIQCQGLKSCGQ